MAAPSPTTAKGRTANCRARAPSACPETRGPNAHAVVREYAFDWNSGRATGVTIFAEGLRNSLALIETKQGALLQAENSRDAIGDLMPDLPDDESLPPDEINLLEAGAQYGWPYCYGANIASPDYPSFDCSGMRRPLIELPAHAAPLSMAWFDGGLIVAYHGFRANGHRIVRFALNADVAAGREVAGPGRRLGRPRHRSARRAGRSGAAAKR